MRIDIDKCTDIELLRREAWRLERVIQANVNRAEDKDKLIKAGAKQAQEILNKNHDLGFKNGLLEERLKEYTDRLNSDDLVMDMVIEHNDSLCKHRNADKAMRAAIKVIKGD